MEQPKKKNTRSRTDKRHIWWFVAASVVILAMTAVIAANFETIRDVMVGMRYAPSLEMAEIRESLSLTDRGWRIFNASYPELKESAEFNQNCREIENESAILGCFKDDKIFVYNVTDEELSGILELTTAHELLHAVYDRLNDSEKSRWAEVLAQVYEENKAILGEEIDLYSEGQKQEELYVRAGTEVKDLPEDLEKHFGEIFRDQDKVVDFYNGYIKVFREIEKKLADLYAKINALNEKISNNTADYEARAERLNANINEFNECAGQADCFKSAEEFYGRRGALVAEQGALNTLYGEINKEIEQYNALVAEYNENVLHGQILNKTINSSTKVEGL